MRFVSLSLLFPILAACSGEEPIDLASATLLDARAVYLAEEEMDDTRLTDLAGAFAFDGAPARMGGATIHPLRSTIRYSDLSGVVYLVDIEVGRQAEASAVETHCDRGVDGSRLDAETGELVYACASTTAGERVFERNGAALANCADRRGPLVIYGDLVLCERALASPGGSKPFADGVVLEVARRTNDRFLAVVTTWPTTSLLVAIDDEGTLTNLHTFAALPDRYEGRAVYFAPGIVALSAGGTLYRIGRLDDPNAGERIVYAFDETQARAATGPLAAATSLGLVTGP